MEKEKILWEVGLFYSCPGREEADDIGLTTLALYFREEEEVKGARDPTVRPEGQVNVMGFRAEEA